MPEGLKLDPLYTIFEKHLYERGHDEGTQDEFIDRIAQDYLKFLASRKVAVPSKWREAILEELRSQVRGMLVKKIYGCLSIQEFVLSQKKNGDIKKTARRKYNRLFKHAG